MLIRRYSELLTYTHTLSLRWLDHLAVSTNQREPKAFSLSPFCSWRTPAVLTTSRESNRPEISSVGATSASPVESGFFYLEIKHTRDPRKVLNEFGIKERAGTKMRLLDGVLGPLAVCGARSLFHEIRHCHKASAK